jgi:hypothetical protein
MKRYKKEFELKYFVDVKTCPDGKVILQFSADCGKFGTEEMLDEYEFTAKELLSILQRHDAGGRSEQLHIDFLIMQIDEFLDPLHPIRHGNHYKFLKNNM